MKAAWWLLRVSLLMLAWVIAWTVILVVAFVVLPLRAIFIRPRRRIRRARP